MHADEIHTDEPLVSRLLAEQFPQWSQLPVQRVVSSGTDNAIYRLGADLAVRLPRVPSAAGQVEKDQLWLPRLAPHLPLAVPEPLALGCPGAGYPLTWGVYRWLVGTEARLDRCGDPCDAATDMAAFLRALQAVDTVDGPTSGPAGRGGPLAARDRATRQAIAQVSDEFAPDQVTAAWEESLAVPTWSGPPVWVHGDLSPGNLLVKDGRLTAVIDFSCLGVADPACESMVAWNLFEGESRTAFRAAMDVDDDTWLRGRGWALSVALIQLPYYRHTNPVMVAGARRVIREVLAVSM
jgi:aminoglycoside phosphotransferase (APT) family kinase protein